MNDTEAPLSQDRSKRSSRLFTRLYRFQNRVQQHWWIPLLAVLLGLVVQGIRVWRTPVTYVSFGRMIVNVKIAAPTGTLTTFSEELNNFIGTQVALMQSSTVLDRAAERVRDLKPDLPPVEVKLQIAPSPKTSIFNLRATGGEPNYTRAYLDACMEQYITLKREMKASTTDTTLAGIRDELLRLEKDLRKGEEELLTFQSSNSVVVLQEQGNYASSYLVNLNKQLGDAKTEFELLKKMNLDQSLQLQRKSGNAQLPANLGDSQESETNLSGTGADYLQLKQMIQLKKAQQQEWSEVLRPKHPKMVELSDEIAREARLLEILRKQSSEQLENTRTSLDLKIQNLQEQVKEWDAKALDIGRKMAEYQKIKTNNERNKQLYDRLLATMQTLDLSKEADPENVTVLEKASPAKPDRANLGLFLLIGTLVGLFAGIGLLFVLDHFDDRPTTFAELQNAFDEPILGQIPLEKPAGNDAVVKILQPDDERHAFVESYRNVRSSLLYMATEGKRPKTLLVTSALPGDGKSMSTTNLAIVLALTGSRVLLVDADLRKGVLHKHLGIAASPGLHEVLTQGADLAKTILPTTITNLSVLPRGEICRNPGELFLKPLTAELLQKMAANYDYVVIDSAPVMAADDVSSLAPNAEGLIFVVRAGQTSARVARAALDILYQRKVNVLGLIFNGVEIHAAEYYFYKYKDYSTPRTHA